MANQPNGRNINLDCGSLHMEILQQRVTESCAPILVWRSTATPTERCLLMKRETS